MKTEKRFGVLGGMSPESTISFYQKIIKYTNAQSDQDHLESIIAMFSHIPDRTEAILGIGENPSDQILKGIQLLARANVEFAVITCNTAHYFLPQIEDQLPIPVLNMIELVVEEIKKLGKYRVGLLATDGTIQSGLYDRYIFDQDLDCIKPDIQHQKRLMEIIYGKEGIKAGFVNEANRKLLLGCISDLLNNGAEIIILGCTELPLVLKHKDMNSQIIDPLEILAKETIKKSKGGINV